MDCIIRLHARRSLCWARLDNNQRENGPQCKREELLGDVKLVQTLGWPRLTFPGHIVIDEMDRLKELMAGTRVQAMYEVRVRG